MLIQDRFLEERTLNIESETKEKSKGVQNASDEKLMFGVQVYSWDSSSTDWGCSGFSDV